LKGEYVKTYYSTRQAERETGIKKNLINQVAKNIYKQAGGYIWRYTFA
jgi:hypothetical protein